MKSRFALVFIVVASVYNVNAKCNSKCVCRSDYIATESNGTWYQIAQDGVSVISASIKCIQFTNFFTSNYTWNSLAQVINTVNCEKLTSSGVANIPSSCPNQYILDVEGNSVASGTYSIIHSIPNSYQLSYKCSTSTSNDPIKSLILVVRDSQLPCAQQTVDEANAWLAQSEFSDIQLVLSDLSDCFKNL